LDLYFFLSHFRPFEAFSRFINDRESSTSGHIISHPFGKKKKKEKKEKEKKAR